MAKDVSPCPFKILIAGAGIAGLALAAALNDTDFHIEIIEKRRNLQELGTAICLPANATACLKKLNILEELISKAFTVTFWQIFTDTGTHLHDMPASLFKSTTPFISIHRDILYNALKNLCKIAILKIDTKIETLEEYEDKVTVIFSDGIKKSFDLVIGADGIYSSVRNFITKKTYIKQFNAICWRSIAKRPSSLRQPKFLLGKNRFLLLHPIDAQRIYCGAICFSPEIAQSISSNFKNAYKDFNDPLAKYILNSSSFINENILESRIESLSNIEWGTKRVILIGDAAHACAPSMQQGGSQALEDALILAEIMKQYNIPEVADRFKQKRGERIRWIFEKSNFGTQAMIDLKNTKDFIQRNNRIKQEGLPNFLLWKDLFASNPF